MLIPKEDQPSTTKSFQPINLCNVVSKLISKLNVRRLRGLLGEVIAPNQSCFMPRRQSIDNVVICQEILYSFKYTKAKRGGMVIMLDLEKAYNRMEWRFVEETLWDVGLLEKLFTVITNIVSSSCCHLLWSGVVTDLIKQSIGLWQGDPLSPFLFVLCIEHLGHWIQKMVKNRAWKPIKALRSGPKVSHLFFADDILLFAEAGEDQVKCIKKGLEEFCKASGQQVNFERSRVLFPLILRIKQQRSWR